MELSNMEIAMLSPVKRKVYLRKRKRARERLIERIEIVPFRHPFNGGIFWVSQARALALQRAFAKLDLYYEHYKQRVEAEIEGES